MSSWTSHLPNSKTLEMFVTPEVLDPSFSKSLSIFHPRRMEDYSRHPYDQQSIALEKKRNATTLPGLMPQLSQQIRSCDPSILFPSTSRRWASSETLSGELIDPPVLLARRGEVHGLVDIQCQNETSKKGPAWGWMQLNKWHVVVWNFKSLL